MLTTGDRVPDLSLTSHTGQPISLAEMWRNSQSVLLVFLRHLG